MAKRNRNNMEDQLFMFDNNLKLVEFKEYGYKKVFSDAIKRVFEYDGSEKLLLCFHPSKNLDIRSTHNNIGTKKFLRFALGILREEEEFTDFFEHKDNLVNYF